MVRIAHNIHSGRFSLVGQSWPGLLMWVLLYMSSPGNEKLSTSFTVPFNNVFLLHLWRPPFLIDAAVLKVDVCFETGIYPYCSWRHRVMWPTANHHSCLCHPYQCFKLLLFYHDELWSILSTPNILLSKLFSFFLIHVFNFGRYPRARFTIAITDLVKYFISCLHANNF